MKGKQRCGNCRFWNKQVDRPIAGYCQRFPPTMIDADYQEWPETGSEVWCGEWQAETPDTIELTVVSLARQTLAGDLTAARALADRVIELTGGQ
jgi:hypothetical protein